MTAITVSALTAAAMVAVHLCRFRFVYAGRRLYRGLRRAPANYRGRRRAGAR